MRISTTQYQATMNQSLQLNQGEVTVLTQKMASGQRIQVPSDDPVDSVRLSRLRREEAAITQYRDNIAAIRIRMSRNEGFLQNMVNEMIPGRDLLVWASDGGNAPDDLAAMVTPLTALRDSLFYNANATDQEGRYIFSGTQTATAPIAFNPDPLLIGSRYSYEGNSNPQLVTVANGITQIGNENVEGLEQLLNKLDVAIRTLSTPGVNVNDPLVRADLKAALDGFDDAIKLLSGKVATLGGSQNILKTLDDNHANVSLSNNMALNDIGALDYGKAAMELNGYQTALQATYKAYAKIGHLTLFSEI